MKRRALILVSAFLLAAVGAFAYKLSVKQFIYYYQPSVGPVFCDDVIYATEFCPSGIFPCRDFVGGNFKQLYTDENCFDEATRNW